MITLSSYLILSAILFSVGLAGALVRRHVVLMLVSVEIMMNAAVLNFLAIWRYQPDLFQLGGPLFSLFIIGIAAAETSVGLALVLAVYRRMKVVDVEKMESIKG